MDLIRIQQCPAFVLPSRPALKNCIPLARKSDGAKLVVAANETLENVTLSYDQIAEGVASLVNKKYLIRVNRYNEASKK